jgi:SAM-dependent methyltransferase
MHSKGFTHNEKIIDVGCGPGIYTQALRALGHDVVGIDPDIHCPETVKSMFDEHGKYDIAICLEVAEHIQELLADAVVEKLVSLAPVIIFSAALPGQGGHGHINCQPKSYWEQKFNNLNYVLDTELTANFVEFMRSGYHMGWLVNNVQIFKSYGDVCYQQIIKEETPQALRVADWINNNL